MRRLALTLGFIGLTTVPFLASCGDDDDNGTPDARTRDASIGTSFDAPTGGGADAGTRDAGARDAGATATDAGGSDAT